MIRLRLEPIASPTPRKAAIIDDAVSFSCGSTHLKLKYNYFQFCMILFCMW